MADQRYLNWQVLLDALAAGGLLDGDPDGQDVVAGEEQAAVAEGRMGAPLPAGHAGALAVEHMDPGPRRPGGWPRPRVRRRAWMSISWRGWRSPPAG